MGVFKNFSSKYFNFLEQKYFPALLGLADSDRYITERIESVEAGISLLKIHSKKLPHLVDEYVKQVMACTKAGISGVNDPEPNSMQIPEEMKV